MSDSQRDSFYLGALLHDIGKFIERAKQKEWRNIAQTYVQQRTVSRNHAHRRYSAAFIRQFRHLFSDPGIERYVLFHHGGRTKGRKDYGVLGEDVLLQLIHIADVSASKERQQVYDLEPLYYTRARLQSIFSSIALGELKPPPVKYFDLNTFTLYQDALFPAGEDSVLPRGAYKPLVDEFEQSCSRFLEFAKQEAGLFDLLPFLQKYLQAVPAQTPNRYTALKRFASGALDKPDVNLFDHLRVTAAIALCLYDEWKEGDWKGKDADILNYSSTKDDDRHLPAPCLLVSGDISGIQDFIFNVPSKGAAKTLKARSFFVQMLGDVCVQKIQKKLDLKPANLLYNGGGQFYFLVPKCKAQDLKTCKDEIARALIDEELFVSLASVEVKVSDFMKKFGTKWKEVNEQLSIEKLRKFKGQQWKNVFWPFKQEIRENDERDLFFDITDKKFKKNYYYCISAVSEGVKVPEEKEKKSWVDVLGKLGYYFEFQEMGSHESFVFNTTDFEGKFAGFRFSVKDLPRWAEASIAKFKQDVENCGRSLEEYYDKDKDGKRWGLEPDNIITYSQLAFKAYKETGTHKLGILKMDVDNLGKLFSDGFQEEIRTPSRMMSLSRSLQWFFEGYMNTLLKNEDFKDYLYPIFSGGDDLFIVGAWHKVFDIALRIQKDFRQFVCENLSVTLSASLLVVDEHYPVSRFAVLAEERLHDAKYGRIDKNSVNVFGQTLSWEELQKARDIRDLLDDMVKKYGETKAVIQKVIKGCDGLGELHNRVVRMKKAEAENNMEEITRLNSLKPVAEKVWRMSYLLRDIKNDIAKKLAESLVGQYENVIFKAMRNELANPMYIAVGARWAELKNREMD